MLPLLQQLTELVYALAGLNPIIAVSIMGIAVCVAVTCSLILLSKTSK